MGLQTMYKLILLLLLAVIVIQSQKYTGCPQNVPIDTGNSTDTFYLKLITLTSFLQQKDDGTLFNAFYKYAKNGEQQEIQSILQTRKKFFIVIIVVLSTVSLSLLLVVTRMGDLHLATQNVFQKLKENGFSSPLSAFYAFVTIVLLASTCINVYQIQSMISRVHSTSCRLDALNQAFLHGAIEHEWDGLTSFTQKMNNLSIFSKNLGSMIKNNYQDKSFQLVYAQYYLSDLKLQYLGIVNNYNAAFIGDQLNVSRRINLTTFLPNLFIDTAQNISLMTPLTNYLKLLQESLYSFILLENALNQTADVFQGWGGIFSNFSNTLNQMSKDFSNDYVNLRIYIDEYMSESKYVLIVCQVVSALTIFCTLAGLFSLKLIQSNYDYFSLSSYKIIWTFHVFMLTANLVFLMIVSQVMIYNKGMCLLAENMLHNQSLVQEINPKIKANSGMYYFYSCYQNPNFGETVGTLGMTSVIGQLISIKQNVNTKYQIQNIGLYSDVLMAIKQRITPYQYGIIGNISFIDAQLEAINNVTSNNYQSEGCYKHHWVYGPQECKSQQVGIIKPKQITFLNNTKNYYIQVSDCYLLSDYTSFNPTASNQISFYQMYGKYNFKCPKNNAALASPINQFWNYFESRRSVFGRLNDQIKNLSQLMKNTSKYLIGYIFQRNFILQNGLVASGINNASELTTGQNCGVIKQIIIGLYNDFCINFAGSLRSIYLLAMCNIAYTLFIIAFSLLYAIQLRNLLKRDLNQSYSNIQFVHTSQNISSESISVLSEGESKSGGSEKAYSQKADKMSKDKPDNK